ncbi:hypothetical protein D3C72_638970 [compost metagenome]
MVARQERGAHAQAHGTFERALRAQGGQGIGIEQAVRADAFGRIAQTSFFQGARAFFGPCGRLRQQPRADVFLLALGQSARHGQRRRRQDATAPRGLFDQFQRNHVFQRGRLGRQGAQPRAVAIQQPVAPQHRKASAMRGNGLAHFLNPADRRFHVAAGLQQRQHRVGRFQRAGLFRRGNAEQLLPVAQRFVHIAQLPRRHGGDAHDFGGFDFVAQQAGRQRVRHVVATQLELIAHQHLLGLAAGGQCTVRAAQQRQRAFVVAQLFLNAGEQQRVLGQAGMAAQHVAHPARGFAQVARFPDLFNALGAFVRGQLGHNGLRRGGAHARTHVVLEPLGVQALGEGLRVVRQVKPAVFHRIGLADLVHQRRRVVARHADALRAGDHRRNQLLALFDRHVVRRQGVHVRDEHDFVAAQQIDELAHFAFDLVVRQVALDDARQQRAVVLGKTLEDRVLVQQRAALGQAVNVGQGPEHPRASAVGEELAEVAPQVVGLNGVAVNGQELARGQLDHIQVGRLVRATASLLAVGRAEHQALHVGRNLGLVEHETRLLQRLGAGVHEAVVAPELQLDRVAAHGVAQRGVDAAGADRSNGKCGHSGSLL